MFYGLYLSKCVYKYCELDILIVCTNYKMSCLCLHVSVCIIIVGGMYENMHVCLFVYVSYRLHHFTSYVYFIL